MSTRFDLCTYRLIEFDKYNLKKKIIKVIPRYFFHMVYNDFCLIK